MLEWYYQTVQDQYVQEDGHTTKGEDGSFMQISGFKVNIDTNVETVVVNENGMLGGVGDRRRVISVVQVLPNGDYAEIDLNKTYTVAMNEHMPFAAVAECSLS